MRANARATPQKDALVCEGKTLKWADFEARQNRVAQYLLSIGLERGDRIAVLSPNSIPYVEVFLGTIRAGGCITPLSTMASPEALEKMLKDRTTFVVPTDKEPFTLLQGMPDLGSVGETEN